MVKKRLTSIKKYVIINYAPDAWTVACIRMQKVGEFNIIYIMRTSA